MTHTIRRPWYSQTWLHVAVILLVAAAFRLWRLTSLPPGLFGDEATDGLDALDVLAGRGAVFFPANYGREGLHMWIVALAFRLLGVTPLALRLPSALAGAFTALATYWLGRELVSYGLRTYEERIGEGRLAPFAHAASFLIPLIAALYVATSYWHVHFSRFGIRGVFTPLCGALAFAAFWRGANRGSAAWFALAGALMGLATHFYTASRFLPFFLAGFLVVQWLVARVTKGDALLMRHWRGILLLYGAAALVFAPLGLYFLQHPGSFSQRASAVTAFGAPGAANPWLRMAQAALANVLQFFVPGRGDLEQFYNLPGRAVFDGVTALLALIGVGALLRRWRSGPALFLLLWFPALLLPSFLATDRWPTLPRVLGVIPGVYFFPAVGLAALAGWAATRVLALKNARWARAAAVLLIGAALLLHAGLTYRDYFRVWGPSQATFDAFEGDMTAAWRWLAAQPDAGRPAHIFLSSDIYRHPTFMLLHERATVQTYFTHANPRLSWFDGRAALPLPAAGPALYLASASAPLTGGAAELLASAASQVDTVMGPDGAPSLTVYGLPANTQLLPAQDRQGSPVVFTSQLSLATAELTAEPESPWQLTLLWQTTGPDPAEWPGYRLEVELPAADGAKWTTDLALDAFRPAEWIAGGEFLTWHPLHGFGGPSGSDEPAPIMGRMRLVRQRDGVPVPVEAAPDGWQPVIITRGAS